MEAYKNHPIHPTSFEQHLMSSLSDKPPEERMALEELFYEPAEPIDEDADDFAVWGKLFSASGSEPREPVEDILARHPVREKRLKRTLSAAKSVGTLFTPVPEEAAHDASNESYEEAFTYETARPSRLRSAARSVGALAVGVKEWTLDRVSEVYVNPRIRRNLGRLAALTVSVALVAGTAPNLIHRRAAAPARSIRPVAENDATNLQIPKAEFTPITTVPAPAEVATPLAAEPAIDLNAIFQQTVAENARVAALKAQEQEEAQAKAIAEAKEIAEVKAAAKAAALKEQTPMYPVGCETYRPLVEEYDDWDPNTVLFVAGKESGCNPNRVSSTNDWGFLQLHDTPVLDPRENIRIAHDKYVRARIGRNNFSAWYAVCTSDDDPYPQPKYPGIKCL